MDKQIAVIEWGGVEYELRYSFGLIRRLKAEGINVAKIFREANKDPQTAVDNLDDIACMLAFVLREAGCAEVSPERIYERGLTDRAFLQTLFELFMWMSVCHMTQSVNLPGPQSKKKPVTPKTKKKAKR